MLKKKCGSCGKKVERKFNYCPFCGGSFKAREDQSDFGMLGREDGVRAQDDLKLPFGMDRILNSLVKQLGKELSGSDARGHGAFPKGMRINISAGRPQVGQVVREGPKKVEYAEKISDSENDRRMKLPKKDAESKVRRLGDSILYEVSVPGVKLKRDVVITKLASGIEIKAYSKEKCYVKFIPLTVEIIEYYVEKEKLFVELKA